MSTAKTSLDKVVVEAITEIIKYRDISEYILMNRIIKPMKSYYSNKYYENCAETEIEKRICPAFGLDVNKTLTEYKNCEPDHITIASLLYYAHTECHYRLPRDLEFYSIDVDGLLFDPKTGNIVELGAFVKNRKHWYSLPYRKTNQSEESQKDEMRKLPSYYIPYNNFIRTLSKDTREKLSSALVSGDIRKIGNVCYNPSEAKLIRKNPSGDYTVNVYHPPIIKHELFDKNLLEEYLIHVEHIVGSEHLDYFLKWMAFTALVPWEKHPHAILLTGQHGSGKSLIVDVLEGLCGKENSTPTNMENLSGDRSQFNKDLYECTLLRVEEAYSTHAGKRHHFYNHTLKELITQENINIRQMRTDPIKRPIWFNLIMTSNEHEALPIEDGDRRIFSIRSKARDKKRGLETAIRWNDPKIWPALLASVHQFFQTLDIANFRNILMPDTEDRRALMDAQSPVIQATRAVFDDLQESERYKKMRDKCYNAGLSGPCITDYFLYTAVMEKIKEETSATGSIQSISDYYIKVTKDEDKKCIFTTSAIEEIKSTIGNLGAERTGHSKRITKGKYHVFFLSDNANKDMIKIRSLLGEIDNFDYIKQFKEPISSFDNVMRFEKKSKKEQKDD